MMQVEHGKGQGRPLAWKQQAKQGNASGKHAALRSHDAHRAHHHSPGWGSFPASSQTGHMHGSSACCSWSSSYLARPGLASSFYHGPTDCLQKMGTSGAPNVLPSPLLRTQTFEAQRKRLLKATRWANLCPPFETANDVPADSWPQGESQQCAVTCDQVSEMDTFLLCNVFYIGSTCWVLQGT